MTETTAELPRLRVRTEREDRQGLNLLAMKRQEEAGITCLETYLGGSQPVGQVV
jgi:hypothetical protein